MRKNVLIVVSIVIIFVICILLGIILKQNDDLKILKSNEQQIKLLSNLYREFLIEAEVKDGEVILSESVLKNIVTRETFDNEEINEIIKGMRIIGNEKYEMSSQYYPKNRTITLNLKGKDGTYIWQKYKLYIYNREIKYEKIGNMMISVI